MDNKTILYVDDDEDDRLFLSETIQQISPETKVVHAENGVQALQYLNGIKDTPDQLPCLVVLDLNMPLLDGKQTYERIQKDPLLSKLPVVIFTSSQNPNDKAFFNRSGLTFVSKPLNISYMKTIAASFLNFCNVS